MKLLGVIRDNNCLEYLDNGLDGIILPLENYSVDYFKYYNINDISSNGYIVSTLEAVIWSLINSKSFNETIIKAINLGEDTDTVGACVGGLAGIYYGIENINQKWKDNILKYDYIINMCKEFEKI